MMIVYLSSGIASGFSSAAILILNGFGLGEALFLGWAVGSFTVGSVALAGYLAFDRPGRIAGRDTAPHASSATRPGRG